LDIDKDLYASSVSAQSKWKIHTFAIEEAVRESFVDLVCETFKLAFDLCADMSTYIVKVR